MAHHSKSTMPFNYFPRHRDRKSAKILTECKLSNGNPCPACLLQLKLKAQIEETKRLLDKLIAEEQQAWNQINHYHDPLHRIPPEITSYIFSFTLPEFELQEANNWPYEQPYIQTPPSEPGVLTLGAVCQLWRNIAWSAPRLWSKILLTLFEEPTDDMIEVVRQWLERSRELPLSIRLYLGYFFDQSLVDDLQTLSFLKLFNDRSARWEDLSIQCDSDIFPHIKGNPNGSQNLETLQLIPYCDGSYGTEFRPAGTMPQPNHITVMRFSHPVEVNVSWNNATAVTLGWFYSCGCIDLLQIAPKLISLRIQGVCDDLDLEDHLPRKPLTFPRLKTFCISAAAPLVSVAAMLDGIALPSLVELDIRGMDNSLYRSNHGPILFPFSNVMEFLQRSSCSLTSFTVEYSECEEQEILDVLYSLPSLKKVRLDIRDSNAEGFEGKDLNLPILFGHLSRVPSATDGMPSQLGLLPNLETFEYHVFKGTQLPWDLFSNIAHPVSGKKRPFKALTIVERQPYCKNPPLIITKDQNIDKNVIRDLLSLQDENIDLYFPSKVSRETLLALLGDE